MVAEARAKVAELGYAEVSVLACDAQSIPLPDDTFGVVVASHMLYHVPDPVAALREMRRLLRSDGVALVSTNGPGHMRQINALVASILGPQRDSLSDHFGIDSGERQLREVFGRITWHAFVHPLLVTDAADAVAYATSYPPGEGADDAQRAWLHERIAAEIAQHGSFRIDVRGGVFVCSGDAR